MITQLRSSIVATAVVVLGVTAFPQGGRASADGTRIDASLSGTALRLTLQDPRFQLSAEPGSDVDDYDVYMATDTRGRRTVLILEPIRVRSNENHFYKWFFDDAHRTYKAIEMTGTSSDIDRLQAEFSSRRGAPVAASDLRASLGRQWAAHLDRKRLLEKQAARRKPVPLRLAPSLHMLVEADGSESEGSLEVGRSTTDVPYCYGSIDFFTYFEDPIWINVAETRWYIEFDGWDATSSYPNCWAKDPGWWPPPANTQWYVLDCSPGGYNNGGFDLYGLTTYNNWDWGDNEVETGVLMMPGLQYTSYWFNPYVQQSTWGEDANYLTMSTDNTNNYLCWYAPRPNAADSTAGKPRRPLLKPDVSATR